MDASIIAYSAQKSLFSRLEMVANNVANQNTNGFQADLAVYLQPTGRINGQPNPVPTLQTATDVKQGSLSATGRQLDLAINGEGYFLVESPLGERYTRNGTFFVGADGALTTKEGYAVAGGVSFLEDDSEIKIGDDGTVVSVRPEGNLVRGVIPVTRFDDKSVLEKVGETYFIANGGGETAIPGVDYRIAQGMLEDSNVNPIQQMTELIDISRSVANLAKIIQDQHQMVRSAVQRITARS